MGARYNRRFGILLHISSLPGPYGIGDMGPQAECFADFLAASGATSWQMLPLSPTDPAFGNSPYSSHSAFAGNQLLISPDVLREMELLSEDELANCRASRDKQAMLDAAYKNFRAFPERFQGISDEFWRFSYDNAHWLDDFALFTILKAETGGKPWYEWPEGYAHRDWSILDRFTMRPDIARRLDACRFEQFLFFRQIWELRRKCNERGIELIGDLPIYVAHDSADVWGNRDLFELDDDGLPAKVAGVPPDYFSEEGQRWGNPLYNWECLRQDGYSWWVRRLSVILSGCDRVRIDHFRGFFGYWAIPAEEKNAVKGEWRRGPGRNFLAPIRDIFSRDGQTPLIAEDLGVITDDVRDGMSEYGLPGMRVLHFAFGGDGRNPNSAHMHPRDCLAYTGTHDNNTSLGWWRDDALKDEKSALISYVGHSVNEGNVVETMTRLAFGSAAELAILPMQDVLGLDGSARMNRPATAKGNWTWRMKGDENLADLAAELRELAMIYGRVEGKC